MARFSVDGDDDGNEGRPTLRPLPKRPRISNTVVYTRPTSAAATAATTSANSRDRPTTSAAATAAPEASVSESETEESDTDVSDSTADSESESGEEEEVEEGIQPQQTPRSGNEARANPIVSGNDGSNGSVTVILADPDVLDCPICYEPLCSPVYQCENGHIACASCCITMKYKCASCCMPIGYNRCRAIEKVLDSVRIACRNKKFGCMETFSYGKKLAHEKTCSCAPCSCPHIGCEFVSICKFVYAHFALKHLQSSKQIRLGEAISISLDKNQKHVYLQEKVLSTVFILNRSVETVGSYVNVVCVAPTTEKKEFLYDLAATFGDSSVKLKTSVDIMPKWTPQSPQKIYLVVPSNFISASGQLKLELTVWTNPLHRRI